MFTYLVTGGALLAVIASPLIHYALDPKGLRRYPMPSVAALTPLWQMYYNWRGDKFIAVDKAHKRLGSVVRLGSNHVSFSSPQAFKDIYGHGTSVRKDTFYDNQASGNPNMADATDKDVHRQKRRNLAHVFSPAKITEMEPRVMQVVRKLVAALELKSRGLQISDTDRFPAKDGIFDVRPWLNMFSYDAITNVFWSQTYGFLDRGNDDCFAERDDGTMLTVNAMHTFHTGAAHSVLIEPDLFSNLPTAATEKRSVPMSDEEIIAESAVMLNAGNDTTQTSLTNIMYYLARYRDIQDKLRNILLQSLEPDNIPAAPYEVLRHIPYLRAVIDESFRMQAPLEPACLG
ncbi:unnamed protein product [Parascedosporium putredinis]|uniref:Cytochrome P450 n=1 Tax=Parascedosporium putredinis TaxID=1442378 RepID=A0A9P1M7Q7_9PEZI|nr:unnamed protein product [Parascedosporium putredinis]CAI7990999.1 unnamed protein product [Parascedosporium putredinis]